MGREEFSEKDKEGDRKPSGSQYLDVTALGLPEARAPRKAEATAADKPGETAAPAKDQAPAAPADKREPGAAGAPPASGDNFGYSYLRALSARVTYLGLTGQLVVDNQAWKSTLKGAGPVGEQLIKRMGELEAKGWTFGSLGLRDPYWELKGQGAVSRLVRMGSLGGYHWDMHEGIPVKRVAYNGPLISMANVMGYGYGTSTPAKNVATIMAHELGHEDGILREHPGDWKNLLPEEQRTMARRMLATESRAIVTQLHVAEVLGDTHVHNDVFRTALKRQDLGGFIHDTWGKSGGTYGAFSTVDRKEAVRFVNQYLEQTWGKDLIDYKSGKIRPFDINAGFGKQVGTIAGDLELKAMMAEAKPGMKPPGSAIGHFLSETPSGRVLGRAGQALGAVGVLMMVNDLRGAFKEGPVAGVAKLARVGIDWGGFEAGTAVSALAAQRVALAFPSSRLALAAIPIVAFAGGMGGSHVADKYFASKVEKVLRETPEYLR